jgi:hypothetical protein
MTFRKGPVGVALAVGIAVLAIGIPVFAASPSPSGGPAKAPKADKGPELAMTVVGTVNAGTDADGRPSYTITADGKTWTLSAGPAWYWGDKNPLAAFVGKSVTVAGTTHANQTELDVTTVDGAAIREPGKPPWAGGPWVVGPSHPGWKDWMADGKPGKGHGRENAPGQLKKESATP